MFCTNCGAHMPDGMKFCTNCGQPLRAADSEATAVPTPDATRVMPSAEPASAAPASAAPASAESADVDYSGVSDVPDGYTAEYPVTAEPEKEQRGHGLVIAAVILGALAVLAAGAFVVVVLDPFGLHLLGGGSNVEATAPVSEEAADPETLEAPAEPVLKAIAVQTQPNKVEYLVGESLDPAGLVLALTYDDDSEQTVAYTSDNAADFAFDYSTFDAAGGFNVTVTYDGLKATFGVTVSEPAPEPAPTPTSSSSDYVLPDSSSRLYSTSELSGLSDWELYVARNEIYARHGRTFQKDDLQNYFDGQSWYTPLYSPEEFDSMGLLNSTEQQNAATILSLEQSRGSQYI